MYTYAYFHAQNKCMERGKINQCNCHKKAHMLADCLLINIFQSEIANGTPLPQNKYSQVKQTGTR